MTWFLRNIWKTETNFPLFYFLQRERRVLNIQPRLFIENTKIKRSAIIKFLDDHDGEDDAAELLKLLCFAELNCKYFLKNSYKKCYSKNWYSFKNVAISYPTLHKKWDFPLRISSVNVTKSTGNYGFGRIYWRNP